MKPLLIGGCAAITAVRAGASCAALSLVTPLQDRVGKLKHALPSG